MLRWRPGLLSLLLLTACGSGDPAATPSAPQSAAGRSSAAVPASFTLVVTGDVLVPQDLELTAGARRPHGSYDFSSVLAPVALLIRDAGPAICRLATPPHSGPYRGYPSLAVQPEIVDALAGAGFDPCSTASNHSLVDGTEGVARTLGDLDAAGSAHSGTYRTEADSLQPTIVDVHGIKVADVAAAYGLNGGEPPADRPWKVPVAAGLNIVPGRTGAAH